MPQLRCTAYPLDAHERVDVIGQAGSAQLFSRDGLAIVAKGSALALELPRGLSDEGQLEAARGQLAAIATEANAPAPLALGAFGFLPDAPARFDVPELTYLEGEEDRWLLHVGPRGSDPGKAAALRAMAHGDAVAAKRAPAVVDLEASRGPYEAAVASALERIGGDPDRKIVLSREVVLDGQADPVAILRRLHDLEPSCTLYAVVAGEGRFVGASPELLMRRLRRSFESFPLAGTVALAEGSAAVHRLSLSEKDRREHALVVQDLIERLRPSCAELVVPASPSVVVLRSVAHLGTRIMGRGGADVLDLLAAIHPTPAVGGLPRDWALDAIAELEGHDRGLWAGAVGWFNAEGDGEFVLGIRGAFCEPGRTRVPAGAGIVQGSLPEAEARETAYKISAITDAVELS